jgi:hypothetical protein
LMYKAINNFNDIWQHDIDAALEHTVLHTGWDTKWV